MRSPLTGSELIDDYDPLITSNNPLKGELSKDEMKPARVAVLFAPLYYFRVIKGGRKASQFPAIKLSIIKWSVTD
jgi:hypothetical protein